MSAIDQMSADGEGLLDALARARMLVTAVETNAERIVERLHDLIVPVQHARTVLASLAPNDPDAQHLRAALATAIRDTTDVAQRSLHDLERVRRLLAVGVESLRIDPEPTGSRTLS
jgi:hypothetical protein